MIRGVKLHVDRGRRACKGTQGTQKGERQKKSGGTIYVSESRFGLGFSTREEDTRVDRW